MTTVDSRQMAMDVAAYVRTLSPSEALGCAVCLNATRLRRSLMPVNPLGAFTASVVATLLARASEGPAEVTHEACPPFLQFVGQLERRIFAAAREGGDQA